MRAGEVRSRRPDDGSALILVLVLMVVGSLIILPLMDYAMAVGRANSVLSTKTERTEAVKAGLRMAMAEPAKLYETCGAPPTGPTVGKGMSTIGIDPQIATTCYFIASTLTLDTAEVRYGAAAVQKGESVPAGMLSTGYVSPDPDSTSKWILDTSLESETDKIWLPNLPTHGLSPRAPTGWQMPPPPGFPACTVYFPGTYTNAVEIKGPSFFASGIYYFENTVLIKGNADPLLPTRVVVGGGNVTGCTTDQLAAFYAVNAPSTHNINGLGATFVFGGAGQLVVANDDVSTIEVQFNKRYAPPNNLGLAPSAGVSIVSVNGELGLDGLTGEALAIDDVLEVPLSNVGSPPPPTDPPTPPPPVQIATTHEYLPSTLVPQTVPGPPTNVLATGHTNSMEVSWTPPTNSGNSPIVSYTVRVASGLPTTSTCVTANTMCVVSGLTPVTDYTFTVEAANAVGISALSAPSAVAQTGASPPPAWDAGTAPPGVPLQKPIIDFALTGTALVTVNVPGYVSIPQGELRLKNTNGHPIVLNGGVLAASFEIDDTRAAVPIGLENQVAQRTFRIVTRTLDTAPRMVSSAIVQINQGGSWAVNSWEVQGG